VHVIYGIEKLRATKVRLAEGNRGGGNSAANEACTGWVLAGATVRTSCGASVSAVDTREDDARNSRFRKLRKTWLAREARLRHVGSMTGYENAAQAAGQLQGRLLELQFPISLDIEAEIRAARIGNPADSVRFRIEGLAYSPGPFGRLYGYPSSVSFPSAGQWVIVATAGNDWGCFVLDVAPRANGN
jgi:hypothetical protein